MRTLIFTLCLILFAMPAFGATFSFAFDPPTMNEDGSPLTDLAGYRLHWGMASGNYDQFCEGNDPAATTVDCTIDGMENVILYFALTAFDEDGNESGYSNEVAVPLGPTIPAAPANLRLVP